MMTQTLQQLSNTLSSVVEGAYVPTEDLEAKIGSLSMNSVLWGSVFLIVILVVAALVRDRFPKLKLPLFLLAIFDIAAVTLLLIGSTIYLNVNSVSGGPVHWHADFEVWACGQEMELRNPTKFLSNKIGTSTLHEHDDKRIHLEGVVVEEHDASLGKFFYVIDGVLTESFMQFPLATPGEEQTAIDAYFEDDTDESLVDAVDRQRIITTFVESDSDGDYLVVRDGQACPDGEPADMQVFLYEVVKDEDGNQVTETVDGIEKTVYTQRKLTDPSEYIISDESVVPPGDCLIFEFTPTKEYTDKKCLQYIVQDEELNSYHYLDPATTPQGENR